MKGVLRNRKYPKGHPMPIMLPPRCWRRRDDCEPLGAIDVPPPGLAEEQFFAADYDPDSFVCCGCISPEKRSIPQDAYRVCWKNRSVDELGDYDEQDLAHQVSVMTQAMAVISTRRVNGGMIEVPTRQGLAPVALVADDGS